MLSVVRKIDERKTSIWLDLLIFVTQQLQAPRVIAISKSYCMLQELLHAPRVIACSKLKRNINLIFNQVFFFNQVFVSLQYVE